MGPYGTIYRDRNRIKPHPVLVPRNGLSGLGAASILPDNAVSTIASTIQNVEGYFAPGQNPAYPSGTLAYNNNNPGNLKYVGQPGATLGANGFAVFPTYADGLDALDNQIQLYAGQGLTINQMMNIYAPSGDGNNNPSAYANTIASALGVTADTPLPSLASSLSPGGWSDFGGDVSSALDVIGLDTSGLDPATLYAAVGLGVVGLLFAFSD